MGIKISAPGLDNAIAGSRLLVVRDDDDEEELMDEVMSDLANLQNFLDKSGRGVSVQASTLGSLEALLEFLRVSKIPVTIIYWYLFAGFDHQHRSCSQKRCY